MKFYIASKLENIAAVRALRDILQERGWRHTYDWTVHGSVQREGHDRICTVAFAEAEGVREADIVIVLLPGGRGTHVELGMALALNKTVVVVGDFARDFGDDGNTCAFYHHPAVIPFPTAPAHRIAHLG